MARVYLDACIVIYLIQGPQELSATILQALRPQEGEPSAVFASDLTRLECRVWNSAPQGAKACSLGRQPQEGEPRRLPKPQGGGQLEGDHRRLPRSGRSYAPVVPLRRHRSNEAQRNA